jgi:hypothetical protein
VNVLGLPVEVVTVHVTAVQVIAVQVSLLTAQVITSPETTLHVFTPQVKSTTFHVAFFAASSAAILASSFNILAVLINIMNTYPLNSILVGLISFIIQASFNARRCLS